MQPGIHWDDAPETSPKLARIDLDRCGASGIGPLIVLSPKHRGNQIHWFGGKSYPHTTPTCEACDAKRTAVWKGYVAVWHPTTKRISLLEFTDRCLEAINAYIKSHGTLRAAEIRLKRTPATDKGAMSATLTQSIYATNDLPNAPDIIAALAYMWRFTLTPDAPKENTPRVEVDRDERINREMHERLAREEGPDPDMPRIPLISPETVEMLKRNREAAEDAERKAEPTKTNAEWKEFLAQQKADKKRRETDKPKKTRKQPPPKSTDNLNENDHE